MLNFEPVIRPQYCSRSQQFINFKSTLSKDACIVISQIVALQFMRSRFQNICLNISILNFEPSLGLRNGLGGHRFPNSESDSDSLSENASLVILEIAFLKIFFKTISLHIYVTFCLSGYMQHWITFFYTLKIFIMDISFCVIIHISDEVVLKKILKTVPFFLC